MNVMADESDVSPARRTVEAMVEAGLLDDLMAKVNDGELQLTGEGGFLPELTRRVLEAGLQAELTDHVGYEKGDPAGRGSPNSRNGSTSRRCRRRSVTSRSRRPETVTGRSSRD